MERFDLILQHSPWLIPLCVVLGLVYAGFLYYRERHNDFSQNLRIILMVIRFLVVSFLAFLLLLPMVKKQSHKTEKPILVFAQDFSSSVLMTQDSTFYKTDYLDQFQSVLDELDDQYQVVPIGFGEDIKTGLDREFDAPYTDMGSMLEYVENTFENRNVGAVFVASDGIINKGVDPYYRSENMTFPIHSIALGDTTEKKEIRIASVRHNDIAYSGNQFPIEVNVVAENAGGDDSKLQVLREGKVIEEKELTIDKNQWQSDQTFHFEAEEEGVQEYTIRVTPLEDEENTDNNRKMVYINVLENKQRILILGKRPHPDMAAVRRAIESNPNYENDVEILGDFDGKAHAYNLVIMHGLPDNSRRIQRIFDQLSSNDIPIWFIAGPSVNLNRLNSYGSDLNIEEADNQAEEVGGVLNENFTLFKTPTDERGLIPGFPPLQSIYGKYKAVDDSRILLFRKVGDVTTSSPLWAFAKDTEQKYAITYGEGIWRWRLYNYLKTDNHKLVDELIKSTVKNLVAREDKSRFRVEVPSRVTEYETIRIGAELYNESYEPVTEPEVEVVLTDAQGNEYPFVMSRKEEAYELNIKSLDPGVYDFKARVQMGSEVFEESGSLVVEDVNLESLNTTANHNLMYRLARSHEGEVISPRQLEQIPQIVEETEMNPESYTVKEYLSWIHLRWLLFVLIGLLTIEWVIRKLNGAV